MTAKIVAQTDRKLTIQIDIDLEGSMMHMEETIQDELNHAGRLATAKALETFDTDGSPIVLGKAKLTARKTKVNQSYETPYGKVGVRRYLYQTNLGGPTYCPMEDAARCVLTSTVRFAKIVTEKYARLGAPAVRADLDSTLRRPIAQAYIQNLATAVGTLSQLKEEKWEYDIPEPPRPVRNVGVGIDGTCMLLTAEGWRVAMTGTISLYDSKGERMHTTYVAATPEYGKEKFKTKMNREIEIVRKRFPKASLTGLDDGAKDNWGFLEHYCDRLVIDFWHVCEYVHKAADACWGDAACHAMEKERWLEERLHDLKHTEGFPERLLKEFKKMKAECKSVSRREQMDKTIRYFENNKDRMVYASQVASHGPIGSGVTEAACKTVVKHVLAFPARLGANAERASCYRCAHWC